MATVKFRLCKPNGKHALKKKEVAIYCRVTIDRENRFEFTTKQRIPPKYWDSVLQEAKSNYTGSLLINKTLSKLKADLIELWNGNKSLSLDQLREKSLALIRYGDEAAVLKKSNDLEEFIKDFIQKCKDGKVLRTPNTIQIYNVTLEHLQNFSEYSGRPLSFEAINLDFYYEFCQWSWDTEGHSDTTVGKHIKTLKTFMQEAFDQDLHKNTSFKKKQFKKLEGQTDSIYLTEDEILAIYNLDLTEHPHLVSTRDLFVFGCWVGLRYSDLSNIKPEQIQGNVLRIRTKKTGEDVVIPFHPIAQAIYRHYGYSLPKAKANANFNYDLKDIGKAAGIIVPVSTRSTIRSVSNVEWVPKWQQITVHTARRSFATNCYKMGVPTRSIMAITGHKTEKAFNKYIKLTKEEHAQIMLEHFQKQTVMKKIA